MDEMFFLLERERDSVPFDANVALFHQGRWVYAVKVGENAQPVQDVDQSGELDIIDLVVERMVRDRRMAWLLIREDEIEAIEDENERFHAKGPHAHAYSEWANASNCTWSMSDLDLTDDGTEIRAYRSKREISQARRTFYIVVRNLWPLIRERVLAEYEARRIS